MEKITETKITTAKGAELRVFISGDTVKIETPIGEMIVDSATKKKISYHNAEKKMVSELKSGGALVEAMVSCVKKDGRELYINVDYKELGAEWGMMFEIVEGGVHYTAAYKYLSKKQNPMKRAWEIRREAAAKFNCKVKEISMGECLKIAWAEIKGTVKLAA